MRIRKIIDARYKETELHVCSNQDDEEVRSLCDSLQGIVIPTLKAYQGDEVVPVSTAEIIRIFGQNKNVYVETPRGQYLLRERLYELEERLDTEQFIRISHSEIVNVHKIKRMDTSMTGTIRMLLSNHIETYVSRRSVSKIKRALGL